jgi:replicative DNA helicase
VKRQVSETHKLAEATFVATAVVMPEMIASVAEIDDAIFATPAMGHMWAALRRLHNRKAEIGLVELTNELEQAGHLNACGGRLVVAMLPLGLPSRDLRKLGDWLQMEAITAGVVPPPAKTRCMESYVKAALLEADRFDSGDFSNRVQTGIESLDRRIRGGLRPGELTLLGAESGGGKSTLAQQVAVAACAKGVVLFVTPEMSGEELALREIVRRSGSRLWDRNPWYRIPLAAEVARSAHSHAAGEIFESPPPLRILEGTDITMLEVAEEADKIRDLVLIVIDYAQLVAGAPGDRTPRYLQVGDVGTRAIEIAKRRNVPVLVASQVNMTREKRGKSFTFRETAILHHKAHNVLIFDVDWGEGPGGRSEVLAATVICEKQRSGQKFHLPVFYDPSLYLVADLPDRGD